MGVVSTPKTQSSIRTIDILDPLLPYLKAQYERTGRAGSFVFLNKNGDHYYDIKRIRDTRWKKLLEKLGIEYRTIYQMRHTFATVMIENGEDILWVSHMLGHTDTSMTLQMYAKYRKQKDKKRAVFLADVL
jgi:integrase